MNGEGRLVRGDYQGCLVWSDFDLQHDLKEGLTPESIMARWGVTVSPIRTDWYPMEISSSGNPLIRQQL